MPRAATGSVFWSRGSAFARVTLDKRFSPKLETCRTQEEADARTRLLASLAKKLRAAGHGGEGGRKLIQRAAAAPEGKALDAIVTAIERAADGAANVTAPAKRPTTFGDVAAQWTSGELAKKHPDHVKAKRSAESDEHRLKHILPLLGDMPISALELEHADRVMATLPPMSQASRRHVAQVIHRVLAMAVYPLKLIKVHPIPEGWLPKLGAGKAKAYLYPDEDAQLLACERIELPWRMLYGFLHREGMRRSEALSLQWHDLDLRRGAIALDRNKTDDPRAWALRPDVVEALCAWWILRGKPGPDEHVFADDAGHALSDDHSADRYRAHLESARVERRQLFERSAARRRITFHDTRATFVTTALANGKSEAWVKARTGHRSSDQIAKYQRSAQMVTELGLGDLRPMIACVPELSPGALGRAKVAAEAAADRDRTAKQADCSGIQVPAGSLPWGFKSPPSHEFSGFAEAGSGLVEEPAATSAASSADSSVRAELASLTLGAAVLRGSWDAAEAMVANDLLADAAGGRS